MNPVLKSTQYVVKKSKSVKINKEKIVDFCKTFHHGDIKHWLSASPFNFSRLSNDEERLNFLLVYSAIGFCYWGDPPWAIKYHNKKFEGSYGMIAALGKAIENGYPILDPHYRAKISKEELAKILKGKNNDIPLFEERLRFIKETGAVLLRKYNGSVSMLIKKGGNDVLRLLKLLVSDFSAFQDTSIYEGKKIYFYKKAQLFISDTYQLFGGEGYGYFKNIHELTTLADYRIPQLLRQLGIISYSKALAEKIDAKVLIPSGSLEEIEIRANTIWTIEFMYKKLKRREPAILPIGINDHLWLLRRESLSEERHHRTLTTAY